MFIFRVILIKLLFFCFLKQTLGATDLEYINFGEKHFLAIANSFDSNNNNYHVKSKIYFYDDNLDMFVNYQSVPTTRLVIVYLY